MLPSLVQAGDLLRHLQHDATYVDFARLQVHVDRA
jgi:hypothetical protein